MISARLPGGVCGMAPAPLRGVRDSGRVYTDRAQVMACQCLNWEGTSSQCQSSRRYESKKTGQSRCKTVQCGIVVGGLPEAELFIQNTDMSTQTCAGLTHLKMDSIHLQNGLANLQKVAR